MEKIIGVLYICRAYRSAYFYLNMPTVEDIFVCVVILATGL